MFTVAPKGKVKLVILFETPLLCSTASIVNGKVALDEAVEKAVMSGVIILFMCLKGFAFATKRTINGNVTNA